jgi:hypothetical protein
VVSHGSRAGFAPAFSNLAQMIEEGAARRPIRPKRCASTSAAPSSAIRSR